MTRKKRFGDGDERQTVWRLVETVAFVRIDDEVTGMFSPALPQRSYRSRRLCSAHRWRVKISIGA
jgi:hypothetical protein